MKTLWRLVAAYPGRPAWISNDVRSASPGWRDLDCAAGIECLELPLPGRGALRLAGMERYNFNVEAIIPWGSLHILPKAVHLYGKIPGVALISRWSITPAGIKHQLVQDGREYRGRPTAGWKPGCVGQKVFSGLYGGDT